MAQLTLDIANVVTAKTGDIKIRATNVSLTSTAELAQTDLTELIKTKYDGTNPLYLTIKYGPIGAETVINSLSGETRIPVVLESYNFPLNTTDTRDAYLPVGTLSFVETTPTS